MLRSTFLIVGLAAMTGLVWRIVAPSRAIWRGDASRVPTISRVQPHARTYLTYCLSIGTICAGTGVMLLAMLFDTLGVWRMPEPVGLLGIVAIFLGLTLLPVHVLVGAVNWPKFLVTPAYRRGPGWLGQAVRQTQRWHRRRSPPAVTSERTGAPPQAPALRR